MAVMTRLQMEEERLEQLPNNIQFKRMETDFDLQSERECFFCSYDLHLSAAGCNCSPDQFSCLKHLDHLCSCEPESNKEAIFPKGFRSWVQFYNVLDPMVTCSYISEILDGGFLGPLFKVTLEESSDEFFINASPDDCWKMVLQRLNVEIVRQRGLRTQGLPQTQLLQKIDGFKMFGFHSPFILQAVEKLDPTRQCTKYWSHKDPTRAMHRSSNCERCLSNESFINSSSPQSMSYSAPTRGSLSLELKTIAKDQAHMSLTEYVKGARRFYKGC
ncbi:Lysine-specific demethylase JMJ15-like protein [Drosera capensis]